MGTKLVDRFDSHVEKGLLLFLAGDNSQALSEIQKAVRLNPDNVHSLTVCAVLEFELEDLPSARKHFKSAANLLEGFMRAKAAKQFPYTSTSFNVYESVLGYMMFFAVLRAPDFVLKGSGAVVEHEKEVRSFANGGQPELLASRLPAFCRSQVKTILDQIVHARVKFSSAIRFVRETTSSSGEWRNGYVLKLDLKLEGAEFGVKGCVGAGSETAVDLLGYVVHDFRIVASPGESWKSDGTLSSVRPGDEHNKYPCSVFKQKGYNARVNVGTSTATGVLEKTVSDGLTVSSLLCGWQSSKMISFRTESNGKSRSTEKDWESRWTVSRFRDGHELDLDKSARKIRALPIDDPCSVNYPSIGTGHAVHDGTWTISLGLAKKLNYKFDFEITVQVGVMLLPRWSISRQPFTPPKPIGDSVSFSWTIHCHYFDSVVELYNALLNKTSS